MKHSTAELLNQRKSATADPKNSTLKSQSRPPASKLRKHPLKLLGNADSPLNADNNVSRPKPYCDEEDHHMLTYIAISTGHTHTHVCYIDYRLQSLFQDF
jgi:hypothetical protein